ncbi:hypothetical protein Tco_1257465, partial [Tanacetum coccineum]
MFHHNHETVYKEWEDIMERVVTTASSLEAEQDSEAQTRFEAASKQSNDPPHLRVNTLGSGEDSMKLKELMELFYAAKHTLTAVRHKLMLPDAFLEKPKESNGFEGIIDFLSASFVQYALMIQALVDKKKVIITETSIRSDLKLDDAEGIDCLPTATIFAELERMSAKTTSSNEFSSTMASVII